MYKSIYLKKGKEESLRRFHPWIFSGAIHHIDEQVEEGEIVRVLTLSGEFLAVGHYQIGTITVRVLSFEDCEINDYFWRLKIQTAFELRKAIGVIAGEHNNTYRLIHGEGDNLPGLVIDCYGDTAVIQAYSIGMHISRYVICDALLAVWKVSTPSVYYKSETTLLHKIGVGLENGFIVGKKNDNIVVENGLKFQVDWIKGQKTGFFIDQRDNRSLLEKFAEGRSVLNMFSYTGGFSVYAMRGGAKLVHSVDSSPKAIDLTNANIKLNFQNDSRHESFCEDAFKFLDRSDDKYDLIILDPPAFAKHRAALHNALKGYIRLNTRGFEKIKQRGLLFTFSCSQIVTKENFRNAVFTAATLAGRKVRILYQLHQPADHPVNIFHPEGEYLKGLVLYVE